MPGVAASVLFVCLGNICRSPTAHGVFRQILAEQGLAGRVAVDSAGTGSWHVGEPPDRRAAAAALARGYDLSDLRGRQVAAGDFQRFDYILAMDNDNLAKLQALAPSSYAGSLRLFLDFGSCEEEVPDPYYGGEQGFDHVLDLVEQACSGLLDDIRRRYL